MTFIAVLDYGIGNLRSAQKALEKVGADARLTSDPGLVRDAAGVVLPGVGNFGRCMEALRASSTVSPCRMISAPCRRVLTTFTVGVLTGMTMVEGIDKRLA